MRRNSVLSAAVLVAGITVGCASSGPKTTAVYTPTFDFSPPSATAPGDAGVLIALVNPSYAEDVLWHQVWPDLPHNLASDFEEMLTARGYTIRGPYGSYDLMVYSDKQEADLVLTPLLDIATSLGQFQVEERINLLGPNKFVVKNGTVRLGGSVTLAAAESLTGTKLWVKSIPIPSRTIQFQGEIQYDEPPSGVSLAEPQLRSELGKALEDVYRSILKTSWEYLDPAEMREKKKEADEIKQKARFEARQ